MDLKIATNQFIDAILKANPHLIRGVNVNHPINVFKDGLINVDGTPVAVVTRGVGNDALMNDEEKLVDLCKNTDNASDNKYFHFHSSEIIRTINPIDHTRTLSSSM